VWSSKPVLTPAATAMPAAEHCAIKHDMTRIMSWPGVTITTT
jgi:hypothetical protein